jgi:DNA anti-recombination protein RmuC
MPGGPLNGSVVSLELQERGDLLEEVDDAVGVAHSLSYQLTSLKKVL